MRFGGFTLLEMMIALAVLSILAMVGIPSFNAARLGSQLTGTANEFVATVQLARSEAIKRNRIMTLCASSDGETCNASGAWQEGWIVTFTPVGGTTPLVVVRHASLGSGWKLTEASGKNSLAFKPTGFGASTASLKVCRSTPLGNQERVIQILPSGSTRVTRTAAGSC